MTPPPRITPRLSFGMAAFKLALLAKLGDVTAADAEGLIGLSQRLLPSDDRVASAVGQFAGLVVAGDPQGAGAALHDFLIEWSPDAGPRDWTLRKDCGHG